MLPRRSPWLDDRATLLVKYLDDLHGLQISEETARHDVSCHVDFVAERMRIQRRAAKNYVTDSVIRGLADHIAQGVADALREQSEETQRPVLRVVETDPE
ncbi:hypothetical protein E3G52_000396 [Mycobacteroides abscessus]|uniref:hypothetical protein n=1 Tax=Mycobacteroides abscessus TaxID=36809 RepID=UPI0018781EF6|nr:hypothetical protein [Mycobacteroides abscessus]MBE5453532.1 hypothetical protein [Mycobacteroides abscessus]